MQTLALIPLVAQLTGLSDLTHTSSVLEDVVAVDTAKGGGMCHAFISWRVPKGVSSKWFGAAEMGGNYRAQSVTCPPGTSGIWDEQPDMMGCVEDVRFNSLALVLGSDKSEERSGRLYRFDGSMILSITSGEWEGGMKPAGRLVCVSSTCSCSFLPSI